MCNFFSREMEGDETQNITIKPCRLPVRGLSRLGTKAEGPETGASVCVRIPRLGRSGPQCLHPKAQRIPRIAKARRADC
jgi:hypothetical protein